MHKEINSGDKIVITNEPFINKDSNLLLLREALGQIQSDLSSGDWFEVTSKIENNIGTVAAEIFYHFADMTADELKFVTALSSIILEKMEAQ